MRLRPVSLILPLVAAVAVLVVALALGKSTPASASASTAAAPSGKVLSGNVHVKVYMFAFEPDNFTVKAGTKITFHNMDMTAHTATALNYAWNTGTIEPGQSKTVVIKKAGTYPYHCLFHAFMTGTLKVVS